jgi:hypothetical protein
MPGLLGLISVYSFRFLYTIPTEVSALGFLALFKELRFCSNINSNYIMGGYVHSGFTKKSND